MTTSIPKMTLATDGSCLTNPGGRTGWAWVAQDGTYGMGWDYQGTNQTAELMGLISALRDHPTGALTIEMDSQYVINIATRWGRGWMRNGWKTADGQPVANLPLVKTLLRLLSNRPEGHTVTLVKVRGHDKLKRHPMNDAADQLAQSAARTAQVNGSPGQRTGTREPFTTKAATPTVRRAHDGPGSEPGQRCGSCNAVIRPVPPHCRCDFT